MKTPETPKTNASAKSTDTEKPSATISVDSKGNASPDPKKADASSGVKPGVSDAGSKKVDDGNKPDTAPKTDTAKTGAKPTDGKPATPAKRKSGGGKAMVLFVLIIVGALAAGWLTRAIWWRDAEPHLAQYVPNEILAEIAPDGFDTDTASNDTVTATNSPNTGSSTIPAPSEDATMAENGDAAVKAENDLPAANDSGTIAADSSALPDGSVVVDPGLTERLSRLEGTINALRERLNNERGDTLNNTVARRMAEIETRTAPIEELARVESELAGVANEMRELSARLSTMEEEVRATTGLRVESRGQAIAMAVTILRDALQRGGPFMIALNQLERSAGDDAVILEQIETLKPLAELGAPTLEKLRQSFPIMAQDAVAAATDDHSGSVLDATWANIKKLIPIRRVDAAGEESLEGRLVLAENALAQDDLDGAVTALEGVEGDHAKAAVRDWLSAAEHRQTLNAAIATLSAHAIGLLTGAEGSQ
ncbi:MULTISPECIES: COG4223 family protein [Thalassospira]|uniref:Uroporphyrinogen III synthase n=2 Tax=Thalassospira TaxID=168934 RepID=A0A367W3J5_9PROT|nr:MULTISPECIES: mitofilin family membrane protein [Thalassospira]MDG4721352.1 mitofilin family membrane protein [Thalassospira sp. FZY0004]RCK32912.1 uroporphyrinogen III synthase [Thalassospira profundimaris]